MHARNFHSFAVACCAAGTSFFLVACGNGSSGGSSGTGGRAGSSAMSSGGSGATSESGGSSDASGATGGASAAGGTGDATGGGSGGSTGGSTGGGTAGEGTSGGSAGRPSSGSGGSMSSAGSGGTATSSGGDSATSTGGDSGTSGAGGGSSGSSAAGGSSSGGAGTSGAGGQGGTLTGAVPSMGCGKAAPATGAQQIDVGGTMRDYILRLPDGYDANTPHRIIFAFHGMQGSADQVDKGDPPNAGLDPTGPYYGIKDVSSDTIFVAGQALSGGWTNTDGRDIDYVKALVGSIEGTACVDTSRVFATGFSFGAIMTITIACNMPDVFRAVAAMSGSLQNGCPANDHSIAYWASHGTMDTTIDISNGEAARDEFVKRNKCSMTTTPTTPDGCVAYQGCADGYPVNWCPFDGIHQPPPFSGPAIWAFLSQF